MYFCLSLLRTFYILIAKCYSSSAATDSPHIFVGASIDSYYSSCCFYSTALSHNSHCCGVLGAEEYPTASEWRCPLVKNKIRYWVFTLPSVSCLPGRF